MRKILFRAWDIKYKRMSPVASIDFVKDLIYTTWWEDNKKRLKKDETNEIATLILQQFTGMKDKNGKEIFEGDIVSFKNSGKDLKINEESVGVIKYEDGGFYIDPITEGKLKYGDNDPDYFANNFYDYDGRCFSWEELIIIGDMYNNPELFNI